MTSADLIWPFVIPFTSADLIIPQQTNLKWPWPSSWNPSSPSVTSAVHLWSSMISKDLKWPQMTLANLIGPRVTSFDGLTYGEPSLTLAISFDPMWPHVTSCEKMYLMWPQPTSCDLSQPHVTLAILMGPQQPFCDLGCPLVILIDRIWPQLNSYNLS